MLQFGKDFFNNYDMVTILEIIGVVVFKQLADDNLVRRSSSSSSSSSTEQLFTIRSGILQVFNQFNEFFLVY